MAKTRRVDKNHRSNLTSYGTQSIDSKDGLAVSKTLFSPWLTQGPKVEEFERALAKYCGAKFCVVVSNGTTALHLAYLAAGLKEEDEVVTTPNTFVATSNMLLVVGAKPVFADIRLDTYNLDETKIQSLVTAKTKAIVPVHFAGNPCAMDEVTAVARKNGLVIIEDACHALGASYKSRKIGGLDTDMTIFSFHPVKPITTGEGGAIVTNSEKYYRQLKSLRSHGIEKNQDGFNVMTELGYNYRLTDLQAALGLSQLKKLDRFVKIRNKIANWYKQELSGIKEISLPLITPASLSGWHLFVILVKESAKRMPLADYLKKEGIGVNFHYPAVYRQPFYRRHGYNDITLRNEDFYHQSCLTLPLHVSLTKKDVKFVSNKIKEFFQKYA